MFALFLLLLSACAGNTSTASDIANHTVALFSPSILGDDFIGSGSYIEAGNARFVVTAAHVLAQESTVRICGPGAKQPELTCDIIDLTDSSRWLVPNGDDLAVILVDSRLARPARAGKGLLAGQEVWLGALPGGNLQVMRGQVIGSDGPFVVVHGYCSEGSSGGGVYRNKNTLIGVISAIPVEVDGNGQYTVRVHELCMVTPL